MGKKLSIKDMVLTVYRDSELPMGYETLGKRIKKRFGIEVKRSSLMPATHLLFKKKMLFRLSCIPGFYSFKPHGCPLREKCLTRK